MGWVYFKSEDEGDGTYDGQIGHAYLELEDGSTGDEGRDLGWMSLADAAEIAQKHEVELDVDGPTREEWDKIGTTRRSFITRLLGRWPLRCRTPRAVKPELCRGCDDLSPVPRGRETSSHTSG